MKAQLFFFNIKGYGEFFTGITPFSQKTRNLILMVPHYVHFTCVPTITTKIYEEK
jgi:hypothetical protein